MCANFGSDLVTSSLFITDLHHGLCLTVLLDYNQELVPLLMLNV